MFSLRATVVAYVWRNGTEHRMPHADFWELVRWVRVRMESFTPDDCRAATGRKAWEVYLVLRWLDGVAGALARMGRGRYRPRNGFDRSVALAWYGAEDDDLEDGAEHSAFGASGW